MYGFADGVLKAGASFAKVLLWTILSASVIELAIPVEIGAVTERVIRGRLSLRQFELEMSMVGKM